ncbi:FAD binding domain-containing protein [Syncephalis pseudoplumigaleata]|uniref:FAD binding domain-containing protein n=1 Tax=Syncephalis pseudoplumigaleata TaxID=1712513 RepID=A0A4P9Z2M2_9FUNG|nr:FAD binding domain-containing protein [Syncephalis pseudoplumigaleata]|eukprot:RKP26773.1 FAD binding domain-containing protein [Syncephalis pseudoplumigaleata]
MEAFARLGLVDKLLQDGVRMGQPCFYVGTKLIFGDKARTARTEYPYFFSTPQSSTEQVLRDRLAVLGVHVQWGWSFSDYHAADDHVSVTLQSVAEDRTMDVQGCYMLGCDGSRSSVRRAIGAAFGDKTRLERMIGMDYRMESKWDRMRWVAIAHCLAYLVLTRPCARCSVYWHPTGSLLIAPLGKNRYRAFARLAPSMEETPAAFTDMMRERLAPTTVPDFEVVNVASFTVFDQVADRFRSGDGRVFLCGDAAHVHHPVSAQGMNSSIGDAENLAWKLGLVLRGAAQDKLLTTYEDERKPFIVGTFKRDSLFNSITRLFPVFLQRLLIRLTGVLVDRLPSRVRRAGFEKTAQLSCVYRGAGVAALQDVEQWTRATWKPFARPVDLCAPGARAIDSTLVLLANTQPSSAADTAVSFGGEEMRVHAYLHKHFGCFAAFALVDEQALSQEVLDSLQRLVATLDVQPSIAPLAIVLHGVGDRGATLAAAKRIYGHFAATSNVCVLADRAQEAQYDHLTMCQQYNCHVLGAPAVYLIRPDAHVACRSTLVAASDRIAQYLAAYVIASPVN